MALIRFKNAYPNYRETMGRDSNAAHFDEYDVYSEGDDKIGSVKDALFEDNTGKIRYLIVNTGFWVFGKDVLLPIGLAHFDYDRQRVYVDGLSREQVENLPEYHNDMTVDRDYENRVRTGYRTLGENRKRQFMGQQYNVDENRAYPGSAALYGVPEASASQSRSVENTANVESTATDYDYGYDNEPGLYAMDRSSHQPIRLYQERLIADKERFKTGEVTIGKRVETEEQEASVPVRNERVVIERTTPTNTAPDAGNPNFREGEVARMETYGERANIHKESAVREEVNVRKETDEDVVTERDTVRREVLDVDTDGNPDVIRR